MMARSLVDLIESKDAGIPVQSINFKGIRHSNEVFSTDTRSQGCIIASIDQTAPACKSRRITYHYYCKLTKAPPSTSI